MSSVEGSKGRARRSPHLEPDDALKVSYGIYQGIVRSQEGVLEVGLDADLLFQPLRRGALDFQRRDESITRPEAGAIEREVSA